MPQKKRRRLFDIETQEVSLVDFAANQKKFLIIKRQEDIEDMLDLDVFKDVLGMTLRISRKPLRRNLMKSLNLLLR